MQRSSAAVASAGDTTANGPDTKWAAFSATAEHLDQGRRYTNRTNQRPTVDPQDVGLAS